MGKAAPTRHSRRSIDSRRKAPADQTFEELCKLAADATAQREAARKAEQRETDKRLQAKLKEQAAIFRLIELADAKPQAAAEIIRGAVAVLRSPADRERLEQCYATITGGESHYEDKRRCVVRLLLDACATKADVAEIGRKFQALRSEPSPDQLRSALEKIIDVFPRPVQEEQARQAETKRPPKPKQEPAPVPKPGSVAAVLASRATHGKSMLAAESIGNSGAPVATHGPDFRSAYWFGTTYRFTANQAACVKLLWATWEAKSPDVGDETLLRAVDEQSPPARLNVLFRDNPAWGTMIVGGKTRGTHRLAEPEEK